MSTRLARTGPLEAALLVAGALLVVIGAGGARSGSAVALLPLYAGLLVLTGALVAVAWRAAPDVRRAAAAGGVLTVLVAVPFTRIPSAGELIVCIAVVSAALCVLGLRGARVRVPRAVLVLGGALLVLLAAVTAVSPDRYGLLRFAPLVLAVVPVVLLVGGASAPVRLRVLRLAVLLAVAESALAVVEPLIGAPQLWAPAKITAAGVAKTLPNPLLPELVRAQGTTGHPLVLGVLLVAAVALLVRNAAALPARLRVTAGVLLGLGLLASGSRNSILIAVALVVLFVPRWRRDRRTVAILAGAAVVLVVAAVVATPLLEPVLASGSATHRLGALDAVPGLLAQPPAQLLLGNGWASSGRMFGAGLLQDDGLQAVDDQFVLLLSQGGLVALVLFVALLVVAAMRARREASPLLIAVVVTCCFFDVLAWPLAAAVTALALLPAPSPRPAELVARRLTRRRASSV